jgi:hypothetical protein
LEREAAAGSFVRGKGKIVMLGFRVQHRAQTEGTFQLLFNAIYWAGCRFFFLSRGSHGMFPRMSNAPIPQFSTTEYQGQAPSDGCKFCGQPIGSRFYRINGSRACEACVGNAFPRALIFGVIGAAIGLALYSTFVIITNIEIGYAALAVGFTVAKAMLIGSKGIGGRRYQIIAALLTYAAVSLSFIPIVLYLNHVPLSAVPLGRLLELALTAPFRELQSDPGRGLIGLVILFAGVSIAWRMAAGKLQSVIDSYDAQSPATG